MRAILLCFYQFYLIKVSQLDLEDVLSILLP